jgi:CHAD domain-containing protein
MSDIIPLWTLHPDMSFGAAAREVLASQIARVFIWAPFLEKPERAREHHQLRITLKQLRYTIEIYRVILPTNVIECVDSIKVIQEELGILHDKDVLIGSAQAAMKEEYPLRDDKHYENRRTQLLARRASMDALIKATTTERGQQHQQCLKTWNELIRHDAFAPIHQIIHDLTIIPERSTTMYQEEQNRYDTKSSHTL